MAEEKETKTITTLDLNKSADSLLSQIPTEIVEAFDAIAQDYQLPRWQVFCGVLIAAGHEGRISAFELDPDWEVGIRQTKRKCKRCDKMFSPTNMGQKFCSSECGNANEAEVLYKERLTGLEAEYKHERERIEEYAKELKELTGKPSAEINATLRVLDETYKFRVTALKEEFSSQPQESNEDDNYRNPEIVESDSNLISPIPDDSSSSGWDADAVAV